ncbi:hypothetical protein NQ317_012295 [Molorchus minor]|uniref:Dynein assembly factor 4, axonemal n=1 Tax=Molorchus minor TaxID=1323400 RepID=A0ABQ9J2D8_9CUCU|nr:hypothetical protein NQ317_012295 [Molorchus minor]
MPVIIKDYVWRQTATNIILQISLRGVSQNKVDIFTSPRIFFFEIILLHSIDTLKSKCTVTATDIIFELKKIKDDIWESLDTNISKSEKQELKKQLLDEEYLHIQEGDTKKSEKRAELKRVAVRQQIHLDTKIRENIEGIKKYEEKTALGDISKWSNKAASKTKITCKKVTNDTKKLTEDVQPVPLPRAVKILQIDFTPREFPTPSRESKLQEETEWLKKQAEARRCCSFVSEDIRPEEKNPQFLKAKGDEFFKNKDYLGAISAYSFGIKISEKFVDLYIARSAVHLTLGNFHKAVKDCTTALELLKPEVPINLKERALCIARRGEALCKLGYQKQGIEEIKFSLKLVPDTHFENVLEEAEKANE